MDNACKFTRDGSVTLAVTRENGNGRGWLDFHVADTGVGLTGEQIEGLFRPFAQVDGSSTRRFGGLGLGLTIAREYARRMGGDVTVESAPGKGSTFRLRLPAS